MMMVHAHEGAVQAELPSDIDIFFILKAVDKANDVGMIRCFVDPNLGIELNPSSASNIQ
jgi:hypothetical protein